MHRYVPKEGDAWRWTLEFLQRTLAAALLAGDSAGAFQESLSGYQALAQRMGRRLAELHAVFVDPQGALAGVLPPAAASTPAEAAGDGKRALRELSAALDTLARLPAAVPESCAEAVAYLRGHEAALAARVDEAARLGARPLRLRVHGDLHLGQILVSHADAYLIDFEGEPLNDPGQRRKAATVYKDLAGMLRSFDYVAAVARQGITVPTVSDTAAAPAPAPGPTEAAAAPPAAPPDELLAIFRARAGEAFLAGYRDARPPALALDQETESVLLRISQLEKAAYEVRYEAAHRPEWLPIPLNALVRISRAMLGPDAPTAGRTA
jgi:maltose alpha-D-glucosyltransferase/alpha-amylase